MAFLEGEMVILNSKAVNGLPNRIGEVALIKDMYYSSPNYDYLIEFLDGETAPVKESEINHITKEDEKYMKYIYSGNNAIHIPSEEEVMIVKVDYFNKQAEIDFVAGGTTVVHFDKLWASDSNFEVEQQGKFTKLGLEIGEFTDDKNKQYGSSVDATYKMIQVLMERYEYDEENYLMPKSLLKHILLQVRMMDKQNRIFNNPSGKNEKESPYRDLGGYSLIGIDMVEN